MRHIRSRLPSFITGSIFALLAIPVWAVPFTATNLVTDDQAANSAQITDSGLKNAWGLSFAPTGPFWVSANGTDTSPLYSVNPVSQVTAKLPLTVSIPGSGVTGQVFNSSPSFNNNRFLFVSQDGTVSGWWPALGTTGLISAETIVPASAANLYTGAAIGSVSGNNYLYAADFKSGTIDVYTSGAPALTGTFIDPGIPAGYAPFNVQNLNGSLYVAYALRDNATNDEVAGPGLGYVDKFTLNGDFVGRVASNGTLDAPWGLAVAPSSFSAMAGDLLVGNFGDGHINIYDSTTFAYLGQVLDVNNQPVVIDGLWAISPGNGALAGSSNLLYFTAGPNDETHGVLGVLTPVPEPSAYAMMLAGLVTLGLLIRRRALRIETGEFWRNERMT